MVKRGEGVIILTASTIVLNPGYKEAVYRVTKAGLRAYAGTLALELAPYGIRVYTVSPGIIYTPLAQTNLDPFFAADPRNKERLLSNIPLGRLGRPEEVAPFVVFLASEQASYATGCDVIVDGGFSLRPLVLVGPEEIIEMNR
jgi:NAD(P)-dependent dehydrogenase (short-subunit alcohol dehydrogenase family)